MRLRLRTASKPVAPPAAAAPAARAPVPEARVEHVEIEVIPQARWVEAQLEIMRKSNTKLTADRCEFLLGLEKGQVMELGSLGEALEVQEALGCGECATVYRARRRADGESLALKVLEFGQLADRSDAAEATAMAMARAELKAQRWLNAHVDGLLIPPPGPTNSAGCGGMAPDTDSGSLAQPPPACAPARIAPAVASRMGPSPDA